MICLTSASRTQPESDRRHWINPGHIKEMWVTQYRGQPSTVLHLGGDDSTFVTETPEQVVEIIRSHYFYRVRHEV